MNFLVDVYPWVKAFHVIAVVAWMAGMLYLPRLYVYHCDAESGSDKSETFKVMERRLLRVIINPAMIVTWILGLALLFTPDVITWSDIWIYVKLIAVLVMSTLHGFLSRWRKNFEADRNQYSPRFYRVMNEVPTALMVIIVVMVIVKPF